MNEVEIRECLLKSAKELGLGVRSLSRRPLTHEWQIITDDGTSKSLRLKPNTTAQECVDELKHLFGLHKPVLEEEIDNLRVHDRDTIFIAMQRLKEIGEPAVEPLVKAMLNPNETRIFRLRVIDALSYIGSAKAVDPLIQALSNSDQEICWHAVSALGQIGDERAIPALERVAMTDSSTFEVAPGLYVNLRKEAEEAIQSIKSKE
ncbi:MAG TPA: HEAT repeat domain-containing protein [Blastocatellia bacterium]|nr:HEAT repeat domain-containing protein [Blastocatellia bacterium]